MAQSNARKRLELIMELERALATDAKQVIRVTSSAHILEGFGAVLENSQGTRKTFEMSRPADAIDTFISHSWRWDRRQKMLALATHLHLWPAFVLSIISLISVSIVVLATSRDGLCTSSDSDVWIGDAARAATVPLVPASVFTAVILWGSNLSPRLATDCFLDKTCIHQTDLELKRQAIESLDLFLRFSRRLLVLWSPEYLSRLWCVYELATFVRVHPDGASRVVFEPGWRSQLLLKRHVMLAVLSAAMLFVFTGPPFALTTASLGPVWGFLVPLFVVSSSGVVVSTYILYQKVADHTEMLRMLRSFRMAEATCFEPADVALVHGLIDVTWSSSPGANDGKQSFEHFVRDELPEQLEGALGARTRLAYPVAIASFLPLLSVFPALGLVCDSHMLDLWRYTASSTADGACPANPAWAESWAVRWVIFGLELVLLGIPITSTCQQIALAKAYDAGHGPIVCVSFGSLVYILVLYPLIATIFSSTLGPDRSPVAFVVGALLVLLTAACWHPPRWLQHFVEGGGAHYERQVDEMGA